MTKLTIVTIFCLSHMIPRLLACSINNKGQSHLVAYGRRRYGRVILGEGEVAYRVGDCSVHRYNKR